MTALYIVLAVAAFFALILLMPVGLSAEYSSEGFRLWLNAAVFRTGLVPRGGKDKKKKAEKKKSAREKTPDSEKKPKKGGRPGELTKKIKIIGAALGKLRKAITIKELTLCVRFGGDDPAKTALSFGGASAAEGALVPLIRSLFRVKKLDVKNSVDFSADKDTVYASARVSARLGALIAIAVKTIFKLYKVSEAEGNG